MVISQGEIWWADLPSPTGSGPGFRRPVVIVQGDAINQSRIGTAICVPLTSNLKWGDAPGNVLLNSKSTGLAKDSVANVRLILAGLDIVLGSMSVPLVTLAVQHQRVTEARP